MQDDRREGKRYTSETQLPLVAILWKRNSCPKDVPCSALPLLHPALIGHCRSFCAAMSHSHRGNPIVSIRSIGSWIRKSHRSRSQVKGTRGNAIILPSRHSLMMLVAARYRGEPLIIINRRWRMHEVISIIVTYNAEKDFSLDWWRLREDTRLNASGFDHVVRCRARANYCNCERSFISPRFCEKRQQSNRWTYSELQVKKQVKKKKPGLSPFIKFTRVSNEKCGITHKVNLIHRITWS